MPTIRIGTDSQGPLTKALSKYLSELTEIIDAIRDQAIFVGYKADEYIPRDLSEEQRLTEGSLQIVRAFRNDKGIGLFGYDVSEKNLRTMSSALLLYKDDLNSRLNSVKADPLMPSEACSPLEIEINRLNDEIDFFLKYGTSIFLEELRSRRERKAGLAYPRNVDLAELIPGGEGQTIEFIERYPKQSHDLAKEIAAFGTSNPGIILLGVTNNGKAVGLDDIETVAGLDKLRTRVEGVSSNGIIPSLPVRLRSIVIDGNNIAVVEVPKGPEPVYYTNNGVPYIRHGSLSRTALPQEVNELVRRYYSK